MINGIHMRKVKKIVVVPLFRNGRPLSDSKQRDEDRYLQLLHMSVSFIRVSYRLAALINWLPCRAFSEHQFFFSLTNDVTVTQQNIAKFQPKQLSDPIWTRADHRYK